MMRVTLKNTKENERWSTVLEMNSNKKTVVSCFGDLMKQLTVHYQFDAARGKTTVLANKY